MDCNDEKIFDHLPDTIEELELGMYFVSPLNYLPSSIKKIIFNKHGKYNEELNNLPESIEIIQLPINYDKMIKNIPKGLKKLICYHRYLFVFDFIKNSANNSIDIETYE